MIFKNENGNAATVKFRVKISYQIRRDASRTNVRTARDIREIWSVKKLLEKL